MKVGSLFTGIGGFDLGFERAGMEVAWQCEIDPHARAVLAKHWPGVPCYDDVRSIAGGAVPGVDLICGGFPCQDVSVAGRRAGLAGERSGLWFEFHRVLAELRPNWVVIENVPGLRSSNAGADLWVILRGLAELGYMGAFWSPDAQWFGVAQRRERVFIVGYLGDGRAVEVLPIPEGMCGNPPARATAGEEVAGTLDGGLRNDLDGHGAYVVADTLTVGANQYSRFVGEPVVANPLTEHHGYSSPRGDGADNLVVASPLLSTYAKTADNTFNEPPNLVVDIQQVTSAASRSTEQPIALTMSPRHQLVTYAIQDTRAMEKAQGGSGVSEAGVSYTLDTTGAQGVYVPDVVPNAMSSTWAKGAGGPAEGEIQNLVAIGRPRRLTPTECERLQGFPDGWTAGQADLHRYKQLGNAVAVPVVEWIGRRIVAATENPAMRRGFDGARQ